MAYIKIKDGDNQTKKADARLLEESERKQKQHEIGNHFKKFVKGVTDKGPETVKVLLAEDTVLIRSDRYLTPFEKYVIDSSEEGPAHVKALRTAAMNEIISEGDLISYMEEKLGAAVLYVIYESYPKDDRCVWLFVLDRKIA